VLPVFVSVTRLHVRSFLHVLPFLWNSLSIVRQARRAPGFLRGKLMGDGGKSGWTVTGWVDEASMKAFRNSGAHRRAMPKLFEWGDESSYAHWEQDSAELPDKKEAHRRIRDEGRLSKVRRPSPAHAAGQTAEPACDLRLEVAVRPARRAPSRTL
jgi:hypothetical protein